MTKRELISEYAQQLAEAMQLAHLHVILETERKYKYMKRDYDRFIKSESYFIGQAVWCREYAAEIGRSPALSRRYSGPWIVTHKLSDVHYRIQKTRRSKPRIVHGDRLKIYYGQVEDTWAKTLWKPLTVQESLETESRSLKEQYIDLFGEESYLNYFPNVKQI